jgi:hypothetical protein
LKTFHLSKLLKPTPPVADSFLSHLDASVEMTSPVKQFTPKPFFSSASKQQSTQKSPSAEIKLPVSFGKPEARAASDLSLGKLDLGDTPTKKVAEAGGDIEMPPNETKTTMTQEEEDFIVQNLKKQSSSETNIADDISNTDFMPYDELKSDYAHTQLFSNFTFKAKVTRSKSDGTAVVKTSLMKRVSHLATTSTAVSEALIEAKNEPVTPAKEKPASPQKRGGKTVTPKKEVKTECASPLPRKASPARNAKNQSASPSLSKASPTKKAKNESALPSPSKATPTTGKKGSLSPSPATSSPSPTRKTPPRNSAKPKTSPFYYDTWLQYDRFIKHKRKSDE